jgi:hypothetical protein
MSDAENPKGDRFGPADNSLVRWRPWPCESCCGSSTALDFLVRCLGSDAEIPELERNAQIDWLKDREAAGLLEWTKNCPHTAWSDLCLPLLAEGSEHRVLFDKATSEVVKITLPGTYGDYYEITNSRIFQFGSTPTEYLRRMLWWERLFSTAPAPIGITDSGQIVSRQKFILGDPNPPQEMVDDFLTDAGAMAVKQSCWLWKKVEKDSQLEIWIGDARRDNFVLTAEGIIPIDIRIWGVPIPYSPTAAPC